MKNAKMTTQNKYAEACKKLLEKTNAVGYFESQWLKHAEGKTAEDYLNDLKHALEHADCSSGSTPASVYYSNMRKELQDLDADAWEEINDALERHAENSARAYDMLACGSYRLENALWLAYEFFAFELLSRIEDITAEELESEAANV